LLANNSFLLKKNRNYDIILFCRQWHLKNMKETISEQKKEKKYPGKDAGQKSE
jgi:hypothetical protein